MFLKTNPPVFHITSSLNRSPLPTRPQFIVYFTDVKNNRPVGEENRLLTARWKAFFPYTIRRGTVMCDGCHNNPERFLLEKEENRIYRLQQNGMSLASFWSQKRQTVGNRSFMTPERLKKMASKGRPIGI